MFDQWTKKIKQEQEIISQGRCNEGCEFFSSLDKSKDTE